LEEQAEIYFWNVRIDSEKVDPASIRYLE